MFFLKNQKGMTITELVVVMGLIVAMTVASIPLFYKLRRVSREKEARELVGQMQARLAASHVNKLLGDKPRELSLKLDSNPAPDECARCFEIVLEKAVTSKAWYKWSDTEYLFSLRGQEITPQNYLREGNLKLTYLPVEGKLALSRIE